GLAAQEIAELDEFSYLALATVEGKVPAEVAVLARDYWQRGDPAHRDGDIADSFDGFATRVEAFLARLHDFDDGSVFVGHGIWIGLLAWRLQGRTVNRPADMQAFRAFQTGMHVPNAGVYRLEIAGGEGAARLTALDVGAA
ncbi:MAG: histidine phosphatase family protein, partial [Stenotrophomonas sp.]